MSRLSRSLRVASVTLGAAVLVAAAQAAASADITPNQGPTVHDPSLGPSGVRSTVGACTVVSSANYLGMTCPRGGAGGLTTHDILGDSPVPDCWETPLSPTELAELNLQNHLPKNAVGNPDPVHTTPDTPPAPNPQPNPQPGQPGQGGGQQPPAPSATPTQDPQKDYSWGKPPDPFVTPQEAEKLNLPNPLPDDPEPPKLYTWRFHLYGLGEAGKKLRKDLWNAHPTFQPELHEFPDGPDDQRCDANHDANMTKLFKVEMGAGNIPDPQAGISPTAHARVGQWVKFWDVRGKEVDVQVGTDQPERLRAVPTQIEVKPLGDSSQEPPLTCPGDTQPANPDDKPPSIPPPNNSCWYRFDHSSAQQTDEGYHTQITTHWIAEKSADGGRTWQQFNQFEKTGTSFSVVTEVQALVVY